MVDVSHGLSPFHQSDLGKLGKDPEFPRRIIQGSTPVSFTATMGPQSDVDVLGDVFNFNMKASSHGFSGGGLNGMNRSRSLFSLAATTTTTTATSADSSSDGRTIKSLSSVQEQATRSKKFGTDLHEQTDGSPEVPTMNRGLREAMEPHLAKARLLREQSRNRTHFEVHSSIANSVGVPYTRLRSERPFLFDSYTHPLHETLAATLGVSDLSRLHEEQGDLTQILSPLLGRQARREFQETYDSFVTSFCIPLLHSLAMSKSIFHSQTNESSSNCISYRYQAFPSIRIARPGDPGSSQSPITDTINGHSIGYLQFHVPLTPSFGTNALYTESHPGKEDWHPLVAKSVGLGFLFDGARCLHYAMENTTESTCVSLNFRIAIYQDGEHEDDDHHVGGSGLCNHEILEDNFSRAGPGYYNDAVIDVGLGSPSWQIVAKKHGPHHLVDPDYRVGFPFV